MGFSTALGALISYAAASAFFWNFPHFLHKKKNIAFSCAHISHRGGRVQKYPNIIYKYVLRLFPFMHTTLVRLLTFYLTDDLLLPLHRICRGLRKYTEKLSKVSKYFLKTFENM